jgi:hypothetical protein
LKWVEYVDGWGMVVYSGDKVVKSGEQKTTGHPKSIGNAKQKQIDPRIKLGRWNSKKHKASMRKTKSKLKTKSKNVSFENS